MKSEIRDQKPEVRRQTTQSLLTSAATIFPGRAKVIPAPGKILLPFQAKWAADHSRLKLAEKSRQIGWTWATAYGLIRRKGADKAALDAWISSRDDIQARLFLEDCKHWAKLSQVICVDQGERAIDNAGHSAYVLQFANGLRLHSMSSNPDAQAGKRGDRVLDEFALHPDPRKLYAIAYPGITWGGSLEIFSTHRGSANFFADLVNEVKHKGNPKRFSFHRVTLQDALEQGFLYKLQQKLPPEDQRQDMDEAAYFDFIRAGCPDEDTFQQEFCCNPSDDQSAFLSYELIQGCEYKAGEEQKSEIRDQRSEIRSQTGAAGYLTSDLRPLTSALTSDLRPLTSDLADAKNPLYIGVDVGRDHDLTVIWVVEKAGDTSFTRRVICLQNETFDAQETELYALLSLPQVRRVCIDETGIGRQFTERAQRRFGEYRVEGVTFTGPVKEQLAYPLRSAFEDRTVRIPNDSFIRADLRAVKKETTASGNIRFAADRGKNGHADRFWALALALEAGKTSGDSGPFYVFRNTPFSRHAISFQIGRASCRERV